MNKELSKFAARLREAVLSEGRVPRGPDSELQSPNGGSCNSPLPAFNSLALELFTLQFKHNAAYRKICESRGLTPKVVEHWTQTPAVPTAAFKELEMTCLLPNESTAVFHSSGTTEQKPSRHYHCPESLKIYEASLWSWFEQKVFAAGRDARPCASGSSGRAGGSFLPLLILTPPPAQAPHSSLVHMFETIRRKLCAPESVYVGRLVDANVMRWGERPREPQSATHNGSSVASPHQTAMMEHGSWTLDFGAVLAALSPKSQTQDPRPQLLLGTAFSFVHLLEYLAEKNLRFHLPAGSRVMETGGYKNRSRAMPKDELHVLITERLGIPPENIVCEYGMSELSSQAYDRMAGDEWRVTGNGGASRHPSPVTRHFCFPPWARVQIISPETGREVADGETGLIRVFDLANVFSVMAIQTEDLGVRRGEGFELIGRAQLAEPSGCSLMTA
ncbi:MAG: hypothetical protein ABSB84_10140 [Verrucomicrobiota bacterium]